MTLETTTKYTTEEEEEKKRRKLKERNANKNKLAGQTIKQANNCV